MTQSLVKQFARYAAELSYADLTPDAIRIAKRVVFDSLATGLGGYQWQLGQNAAAFAVDSMPGSEATVLGSGRKASLEGATFANATMIKILGMDDSHRAASHIAAQVIPAALAVAEARGTSGSELLVAIIAGYELAVRVGQAVRMAQRERGLDVKGTVGPIAAALAAGRCAGLDAGRLAHALALGANMGSGTEQYVYERGKCDTKDLLSGFAARNGVFAVRLAEHDFHGPSGALDGEYGFFRAFGDHNRPELFGDLGQGFAIVTTGFKPHGGCRHTHQAVDAVQQILARQALVPAAIERVTIRTYGYALRPGFRIDADPATRENAGMSIRVATAIALVRGNTWPADFSAWEDPEVRRLRHLIDLEIDPEIDAQFPNKNGCRVLVSMRDGTVHEGYVQYAKGEPEFELTDVDFQEKFAALNGDIIPPAARSEIWQMCDNLEELSPLTALMQACIARRLP